MPTSFACPECHSVLKTKAEVPAGKKVKCPKCAALFAAPAEDAKPQPARATAAIELLDEARRLIARLDHFECVIDASLNLAFRRNQLPSQFSVVSS